MIQVINNLIINADHSMPNGGQIKVCLKNSTINKKHVLPLKEGNYVKISIEDFGIGIPDDIIPRIFDPYFTTKNEGSGLGLATSYSIVKKHDGHITVESKPGQGSIFYIFLPASLEEISLKKDKNEIILQGKGKILIMDDERVVRKIAGQMLKHLGYNFDFAKDGMEAIELYKKAKKSKQPFDVVIIDLTIPGGMGGKETIENLLKIEPKIKAVVSSGYSNDQIMADFNKFGFCGYITKPYNIKELSRILYAITKNENG